MSIYTSLADRFVLVLVLVLVLENQGEIEDENEVWPGKNVHSLNLEDLTDQ